MTGKRQRQQRSSIDTLYGRFVLRLRKKLGLTLSQMARLAGMSVSYWSQLEKGEKGAPRSRAVNVRLAQLLYLRHKNSTLAAVHALTVNIRRRRKRVTWWHFYYILEAKCGRLPKSVEDSYRRDPIAFLANTGAGIVRCKSPN